MNYKYNILVVEDEKNILNFISTSLKANNYNVLPASNGAEAIMYVTSHCPDVIILDLGLPDIDGINIIKQVREWSQMPIIVVSARSDEQEKVKVLDAGADDYITKPFGTSELLARIRTAIRHLKNNISNNNSHENKFVVGNLTIDHNKRRVYVDNVDAMLTNTEYKLLSLLSKYAGNVLTYEFIIKNIWGPHADDNNQILRVNMSNIRRKIEENPADPKYVFTEIGVGYRMAENE